MSRSPVKQSRPIALSGFMGAGKSTVGRRLARSVGRMFVDLDAEIEAAFGRSIALIFDELGESAFRQMEARLLRQALCRPDRVVALGGGAVILPESRAFLLERAHWVHLDLPFAELERRVRTQGIPRPMWTDRDEAHALWMDRQSHYGVAPYQIDGDQLTGDVAQALADMGLHLDALAVSDSIEPVTVVVDAPSGPYEVVVGRGLMGELGPALQRLGEGPIALITDQRVGPLHGEAVETALAETGRTVHSLCLPSGEIKKVAAPVLEAVDRLLDIPWSRKAPIVALGGGVLGDMAGLAASLCLRGVPLVQLPTTLLAMVDSSVGGKVGVNHRSGKNRIGAFHHPALVWIDLAFLDTLPDREYRAGLAEVLKAGLLGAPEVLDLLENEADAVLARDPVLLQRLVRSSLQKKAEVVSQDPGEADRRRILNLGHSLGHAIELVSGLERFLHGEAVSIGLVASAVLSASWGFGGREQIQRIRALVSGLGLPDSASGLQRSALIRAFAADKKVVGDHLSWVVLNVAGEAQVVDRPLAEAPEWMAVLEAEGVLPRLGVG